MSNAQRVIIVAGLVFAVAAVVASKQRGASRSSEQKADEAPASTAAAMAASAPAALPRLVDLGAGKCVPCKMMMPILAELRTGYAGRLQVEFIDVWENPAAGRQYGVSTIPTQIFYDAAGKELHRHEGFISKADILAKWKELGVELEDVRREM